YVRRKVLDQLEPPPLDLHAATWTSAESYELRPDARRFENWEMNTAGKIGLGVAIEYALVWGLETTYGRVTALTRDLRGRLAAMPTVTVQDQGIALRLRHLHRCGAGAGGHPRHPCGSSHQSDTPRGLKPHGFSVQRPSHRRDSPKALSAPLDVSRRVFIAVQDKAAVGADMGTHREHLLAAFPAPAALLAGVCRVDCFHSLPGACCLESENGQEASPAGVVQAFVEAGFPRGPIGQIPTIPIRDGRGASAQVGGRNGF